MALQKSLLLACLVQSVFHPGSGSTAGRSSVGAAGIGREMSRHDACSVKSRYKRSLSLANNKLADASKAGAQRGSFGGLRLGQRNRA